MGIKLIISLACMYTAAVQCTACMCIVFKLTRCVNHNVMLTSYPWHYVFIMYLSMFCILLLMRSWHAFKGLINKNYYYTQLKAKMHFYTSKQSLKTMHPKDTFSNAPTCISFR